MKQQLLLHVVNMAEPQTYKVNEDVERCVRVSICNTSVWVQVGSTPAGNPLSTVYFPLEDSCLSLNSTQLSWTHSSKWTEDQVRQRSEIAPLCVWYSVMQPCFPECSSVPIALFVLKTKKTWVGIKYTFFASGNVTCCLSCRHIQFSSGFQARQDTRRHEQSKRWAQTLHKHLHIQANIFPQSKCMLLC